MALPFVLDVAIGLVFIYLILSLLASEIQELLTTLFQWRAKHLKEAIEVFLAGGSATPEEEEVRDLVGKLYEDPLLKNINQQSKSLVARSARVVTQWLIPGNRKGAFGPSQSTGPSYIAPETFATSLLERVGLATLAKTLIEVRLEKFAARIVGDSKVKSTELPISGWDKGRIRIIAEKAKKDLNSDSNFATLVEEYDDLLNDFKTGEATLATSVERMGESLDAYINNYPLPNSQTELPTSPSTDSTSAINAAPPIADSPVSSEASTGYEGSPETSANEAVSPEASAPLTDPTASTETAVSTDSEDLIYFSKRLKAFKLSLFGEKNDRAVLSGGLRPSLAEIAELVNESSTTYQEVSHAYKSLIAQAEPLEAKVNPELEQQLLEAYPEAIEKEIVQTYPEAVEEQFLAIAPDVFQRVEQQLIDRRRKIYRAKANSQTNLLKQQRRAVYVAFDQLGGEQRQEILKAVLNQFGGDQRTLITYGSLDKLSNEQRYAVTSIVFANLGLTDADRSVYDNYQTYKAIRQVLGELPNSVKESFAILARRAQSKVQQSSHDLNQFREEVETWFDNSMNRASGVYKRNAKGVAILIGLVLASGTNSDAFYIVNRLSNDENLRQVITNRAAGIPLIPSSTNNAPAPSPNPGATTAAPSPNSLDAVKLETDRALKDLSLPIGWKPENLIRQFDCPPIEPDKPKRDDDPCKAFEEQLGASNAGKLIVAKPIELLKLFIGWIVSGIAISMGAPFWFDLLGKVMNVRNSGSKPQSPATKETAK